MLSISYARYERKPREVGRYRYTDIRMRMDGMGQNGMGNRLGDILISLINT